jgi:hypothetical protein
MSDPSTSTSAPAAPDTAATDNATQVTPGNPAGQDATPPPVVEAKKDTGPTAAEKFAAAAKLERSIRQRERAVKEAEADVAAVRSLKEQAKANPRAILEHFGLEVMDFVNAHLADSREPTVEEKAAQLVQAEMAKAEKARKEAEEAAAKERDAAAIATFKTQAQEYATANAAKYPLVVKFGHVDVASDICVKALVEHGKRITLEDALAKLESELRAEAEEMAKLLAPAAPAAQAKTEPEASPPSDRASRRARTLTNASASAVAPVTEGNDAGLTRAQRRERALERVRALKAQ